MASSRTQARLGTLPVEARRQWEAVFQSCEDQGFTPRRSAMQAWGALRRAGWSKDADGRWSRVRNPAGKIVVIERKPPGPPEARRIFDRVYSRERRSGKSPSECGRLAGEALRQAGWYSRGGNWHKRKKARNPGRRLEDGRVLKRAPVGGLSATMTDLGRILEVETHGGIVRRWKRGPVLLWDPRNRALMWIDGSRVSGKRTLDSSSQAAGVYKRWSGREAMSQRSVIFPQIEGQWVSYGPVQRTDYHSNKWGPPQPYTHDHGPGVNLYRFGGARPPWLWCVRGGRLRITKRGIEG